VKKPGSGAKEGYQPGEGEMDANRTEEVTSNPDKDSWQGEKPGTKPGDGASSEDRREPGKYKGFLERFHSEVQKHAAKPKDK
jgi:hypothetical protein